MSEFLVDGLGLWFQRHVSPFAIESPALFLDRDGVIVDETHYLGRAEDVCMIPSAAAAIALAKSAGYAVIIVTNQAGIGRGYYGWSDFVSVQDRILSELARQDARVDAVLACAFHHAAQAPYAHVDHPWRKPNPGMLQFAAKAMNVDLSASVIVGDRIGDLEAGRRAGLLSGCLVETGHGNGEVSKLSPELYAPMTAFVAEDVFAAAQRLCSDRPGR